MKRLSLLSFILILGGCHSSEPDIKPLVDVTIQRSTVETVPLVVSGPATIFGKSEAKIASRITAPVAKLLVHKGEDVRRGQLLAVLENADLRAQTADAGANVANAQANLQKIQAGLVPTELSQAKADYDARAAAFHYAEQVATRRKELYAQGAIAGREAQLSQADAAQAKANLDAATTRLHLIEQQTGKADVRIAQSALAQANARNQLAAANLGFTEIRSSMNGTITDQTMFPGDMATPNAPMFSVADLSLAVARAQIDADSAVAVKVGQPCSFEFKQSAVSQEPPRTGKITVVNQAVDSARHTIEVWCEIPNADRALKSGIFGSVKVSVGQVRDAVLVPLSAAEFEEGTNKAKVYTVDSKKIAHQRPVQAVVISDERVRILSGLKAGEQVITVGEYGLPDGTAVNPSEVRP